MHIMSPPARPLPRGAPRRGHWPDLLVLTALLLAAFGGVIFGPFSCGAPRWHFQAYLSLAVPVTCGAALLRGRLLITPLARVSFPIAVLAVFLFARAAAAAFYPASPTSIRDLVDGFRYAICNGPC